MLANIEETDRGVLQKGSEACEDGIKGQFYIESNKNTRGRGGEKNEGRRRLTRV